MIRALSLATYKYHTYTAHDFINCCRIQQKFYSFRISTEYPEMLLSQEEKLKLINKQALENIYHKFVENNLILHQGLLDKRKVRKGKMRESYLHLCLLKPSLVLQGCTMLYPML